MNAFKRFASLCFFLIRHLAKSKLNELHTYIIYFIKAKNIVEQITSNRNQFKGQMRPVISMKEVRT